MAGRISQGTIPRFVKDEVDKRGTRKKMGSRYRFMYEKNPNRYSDPWENCQIVM